MASLTACGSGNEQGAHDSLPTTRVEAASDSGQASVDQLVVEPSAAPGSEPAAEGEPPAAQSRGPERSVYSLIDNRLGAHLYRRGGLVIPAGSAGFAKYLRFRKSKLGWKLGAERDGRKVAILQGPKSVIEAPLGRAQIGDSPRLRIRAHSERPRTLTVRINDDRARQLRVEIPAGWSTSDVAVPGDVLVPGENQLLFLGGKGRPMAIEWIQIGSQGVRQKEGEIDDAPIFYARESKSLVLPADGGVSFYLMVPEKSRLTGAVTGAKCQVEVEATSDSGAKRTGQLAGPSSGVDLGDLAGTPVRLDLRGKGCDVAYLSDAALVVPGSVPEIKRGQPPKYIVFWIMDSLRADRVKIFNPRARPEVPVFERLAKSSAVFLQHYVQGNESRVSHASAWSSLYPVKHNMISRRARLAAKWTTIDEVVRSAGMFTSGVSANGYVAKKWGFGAAWNRYRNHIHEGGGLRGKHVFGKAIASIAGVSKPWFLYIGTIDTHVAWIPKQPWIERYHPNRYKGRFAKRFSGHDADRGAAALKMKPREITWVRAIYDSNVSYQDQLLGQLLDKLDEWGIADQTMIIITADHGDEQFEAGRVGHGGTLRETLIHVPLLMHYPPMLPGGDIAEGAEVLDVVPTLADILGVPMDPEWQGESLVPLAHGVGRGYPRMSMASLFERAHAGRMGPWKIIAAGSDKPRVYNLVEEPGEDRDRVDQNPIARRFLSDPLWLLRTYNRQWRKSQWGNAANVKPAFAASFGE